MLRDSSCWGSSVAQLARHNPEKLYEKLGTHSAQHPGYLRAGCVLRSGGAGAESRLDAQNASGWWWSKQRNN